MALIQFVEKRYNINILRVQTDRVTGEPSRLLLGNIRRAPEPATVALLTDVSEDESDVINARLAIVKDQIERRKLLEAHDLQSTLRDTIDLIRAEKITDKNLLAELQRAARSLVQATQDALVES